MIHVLQGISTGELAVIEHLIAMDFNQPCCCPIIPEEQERKETRLVVSEAGLGLIPCFKAIIYFAPNLDENQVAKATERIDQCLIVNQDWM